MIVRSLVTIGAACALFAAPIADARPRHSPAANAYSRAADAYIHQSATSRYYHDAQNASMTCSELGNCPAVELASTETAVSDLDPDLPVTNAPLPRARVDVRQEDTKITGHRHGLARLSNGGLVAAWAKDRFQAFFDAAAKLGYPAGNLSGDCYVRKGHQWDSKHKWGGACDGWGQTDRNHMARHHMPPWLEIKLANKYGLESGCSWYRDPRGPDCGHIQVRGSTYRQFVAYVGNDRTAILRRRYSHERRRHHHHSLVV